LHNRQIVACVTRWAHAGISREPLVLREASLRFGQYSFSADLERIPNRSVESCPKRRTTPSATLEEADQLKWNQQVAASDRSCFPSHNIRLKDAVSGKSGIE